MTDLPSNRAYIQSEETDTESPTSEQTLQKIGSAINFLNDLFQQVEQFTSGGTFTVPEGIERIYVLGAGGGGGGGIPQGGGGSGAIPQLVALPVTPLDQYTVTIGSGGAGGAAPTNFGSNGGTTSFIHTVDGTGPVFYGGAGGGHIGTDYEDMVNGSSFSLLEAFVSSSAPATDDWSGAAGMGLISQSISSARSAGTLADWTSVTSYTLGGAGDTDNTGNGTNGQDSPYAKGGLSFNSIDSGGGGGAGFGDGANGGTIGNQGGDAAANSSAGGGGGNVTRGGNGGSGILFVLY